MFAFECGGGSGVTVFYPGLMAGRRQFHAYRESSLEKHVFMRIAFQCVIAIAMCMLFAMGFNLAWIGVTVFVWVLVRLRSFERVVVAGSSDAINVRCASVPLWIDHFTYYGLILSTLILGAGIGFSHDGLWGVIYKIAFGLAVFVGMGPIWSLIFRRALFWKR